MTLIAICCHDTAENKRTEYTKKTLFSLLNTVDFDKHRLGIFDNDSCEETKYVIAHFKAIFENLYPKEHIAVLTNDINIGTAAGINAVWKTRKEGEHAIKMDNDVVIHYKGWVEELGMAVEREPSIGIIALKRKDLEERPDHDNEWYRSELKMLPHKRGERWAVVEEVKHAIGTCQLFSDSFLKKFGYLYQPSVYAFDDSIAGYRAVVLGFKSAFLPHIHIEHIDTGGTDYIGWKQQEAGNQMDAYNSIIRGLSNGRINPYYDGVHHKEWAEAK